MAITPYALEISVLVLGLLLLMVEAFAEKFDKKSLAWSGIWGLAAVLFVSFFVDPDMVPATGFYTADKLAIFFKQLALLTTIIVLIMSIDYAGVIRKFTAGVAPQAGVGEYFALPVLTCAGLMWMASAADFVMIFVSLETVTISFYVMVAYMRRNVGSLEAGVKYLILSALSTGFLVYGITWIFGVTGQTNLALIETTLPSLKGAEVPLLFGLLLVLVALGFKIAAVPFQIWVPDVYQGAPTPTTAFLSVGSKAAGFVVLIRVLKPFLASPEISAKAMTLTAVLAGATLIYGNLAALPQQNLKRLLAYSSIAHAGYLLIGITCLFGNSRTFFSEGAIGFYLAGYLLMTLLSFLVMIVVSNHGEGDDIIHFNGLRQRSPFLAFAMLIAMLSLAGLPFTAGFVGKFYIFGAAVENHHWVLMGLGVVTVGCGFYYYLKVVRAMFWQSPPTEDAIPVTALTRVTIGALIALIIVLGVYPAPVIAMLRQETPALTSAKR